MATYLLLLRDDNDQWRHYSPDDMERIINRFIDWNRSLREADILIDSRRLTRDLGNTVRQSGDDLVVDGPYSEAKEAVAGYFVIRADSAEAAREIAKQCPILAHGGTVEVREVFDSGT